MPSWSVSPGAAEPAAAHRSTRAGDPRPAREFSAREGPGTLGSVADRPGVDIISGGRDPDRRRPVSWRLIAGVTAAVLIAGGVTVHLILGSTSHRHHHPRGGKTPSAVTLAVPPMLRGTVLHRGIVAGTLLVLAGDDLRLLTVPEATTSPGATPSSSD